MVLYVERSSDITEISYMFRNKSIDYSGFIDYSGSADVE